jgi:hypothetical protein
MIVNDNSSIVNKLETSVIDDARVIIYDHHMFIVQATKSISQIPKKHSSLLRERRFYNVDGRFDSLI